MSSKVTDKLTRAKLRQLLSAVGTMPQEDGTPKEAAEYNWFEPHYFSSEQLEKLTGFAEKVATSVAEKFAGFYRDKFDVTIISTSQHFASEFLDVLKENQKNDYYLSFGTNQEHLFGLLGIPEQTAAIWAKQLLGDSEIKDDSAVDLSQLEESLLLDLASALVEVFSCHYPTCDIQAAKSMVRGQWPPDIHDKEEVCKISFKVKKTDSQISSEAYFLTTCEKLDPLAGKTTLTEEKLSSGDIYKTILEHIKKIPVSVTAQLGTAELCFEDMMNLQVGDIVMLNKTVEEPVTLVVDGQTVCYGRLAKCAGEYAVTISASTFVK